MLVLLFAICSRPAQRSVRFEVSNRVITLPDRAPPPGLVLKHVGTIASASHLKILFVCIVVLLRVWDIEVFDNELYRLNPLAADSYLHTILVDNVSHKWSEYTGRYELAATKSTTLVSLHVPAFV